MKKSVLLSYDKYQSLIGQVPGDDNKQQDKKIYHEELILSTIPKKMKHKAMALLAFIKNTPISWNEQLEVTEPPIPKSNICDLLKATLWQYKDYTPVGLQIFIKALASYNVPETLIQHSCRINMQDVKSNKCITWLSY